MKVKIQLYLLFFLIFSSYSPARDVLHVYLLGGVPGINQEVNRVIRGELLKMVQIMGDQGNLNSLQVHTLFQSYLTKDKLSNLVKRNTSADLHLFYLYGSMKILHKQKVNGYLLTRPLSKSLPAVSSEYTKKKLEYGPNQYQAYLDLIEKKKISKRTSWFKHIVQDSQMRFISKLDEFEYDPGIRYYFIETEPKIDRGLLKPPSSKKELIQNDVYYRFMDMDSYDIESLEIWLNEQVSKKATCFYILHPYLSMNESNAAYKETPGVIKNGVIIRPGTPIKQVTSSMERFFTRQVGSQIKDLKATKTVEDFIQQLPIDEIPTLEKKSRDFPLITHTWIPGRVKETSSLEPRYRYSTNANTKHTETLNFISYEYVKKGEVIRKADGFEKVITYEAIPGKWE